MPIPFHQIAALKTQTDQILGERDAHIEADCLSLCLIERFSSFTGLKGIGMPSTSSSPDVVLLTFYRKQVGGRLEDRGSFEKHAGGSPA